MSTRRSFFKQLASGLIAVAAPTLFLPKLIEIPKWKKSFGNIVWCSEISSEWSANDIALYNKFPFYIMSTKTAFPYNIGDTIRYVG